MKKWLEWLSVIHDEIQSAVIAKNIFWRTQSIIKANQKIQKPSIFYTHLGNTYVSHVVMCVRRQLKIDKTSISFARLLEEIVESPQTLSREYFVELYKGSHVEYLANSDFDKFSGVGQLHVSIEMVRNDLERLRNEAQHCEDYADKRIAHRDKRNPKSLPTFENLDKAVALLDELYIKYHLLFRAQSMDTLMPVIQYDWEAVFREPWLDS